MALSSFDKTFVVASPEVAERIRQQLEQPAPVAVAERQPAAEPIKGRELIRQRLAQQSAATTEDSA